MHARYDLGQSETNPEGFAECSSVETLGSMKTVLHADKL